MTKSETVARLKQGLKNVSDKRVHAMVDLEINRINKMSSDEFIAYLDKYTPAEPNDNVQVRRRR